MIRLSWHTHTLNKISNFLPQYVWKASTMINSHGHYSIDAICLSCPIRNNHNNPKKVAKITTHQNSKRLLIHYASLKFQIGPSSSCRLQFTRHLICGSWLWALRTFRTWINIASAQNMTIDHAYTVTIGS